MEDRYDIYSDNMKRLSISVVNSDFGKGYDSLKSSKLNKGILPFKNYFGFDVLRKDVHTNVSYSGFQGLINEVKSEMERHCKKGCIAMTISSHGKIEIKDGKMNHLLLCSEYKSNDNEKTLRWFPTNYLVQEVRECFNGPLIILIQACRGDKEDYGVQVYKSRMSSTDEELESGIGSMSVTGPSEQNQELGTDQPCGTVTNQGSSQAASTNQDDPQAASTNQDDPQAKSTNQDDPQAKSTNQDDPQAKSTNQDDPQSSATHQQDDTQASNSQDEDQSFYEVAPICPADTVVAFASPHGYISKSSSKTGGWLLHSFDEVCERYKNNTEGLNILHLLTQANSPVCSGMASKQYNGGKKCIGSFQHRLVKELILETRPVADEDEAVDE